MTKWTPGPWETTGKSIYASGKTGANIAEIGEPRASRFVEHIPLSIGSPDRVEAYANAHLIAASPELDKMLGEFLNYFALSEDQETTAMFEKARTIRAKARGETP